MTVKPDVPDVPDAAAAAATAATAPKPPSAPKPASAPKPVQADPTAPARVDVRGFTLDGYGLPIAGPERSKRLAALAVREGVERADPAIDPDGWDEDTTQAVIAAAMKEPKNG